MQLAGRRVPFHLRKSGGSRPVERRDDQRRQSVAQRTAGVAGAIVAVIVAMTRQHVETGKLRTAVQKSATVAAG